MVMSSCPYRSCASPRITAISFASLVHSRDPRYGSLGLLTKGIATARALSERERERERERELRRVDRRLVLVERELSGGKEATIRRTRLTINARSRRFIDEGIRPELSMHRFRERSRRPRMRFTCFGVRLTDNNVSARFQRMAPLPRQAQASLELTFRYYAL